MNAAAVFHCFVYADAAAELPFAATEHAEDAAALLAACGKGTEIIRDAAGTVLWTEGEDGEAGASYDYVAEKAFERRPTLEPRVYVFQVSAKPRCYRAYREDGTFQVAASSLKKLAERLERRHYFGRVVRYTGISSPAVEAATVADMKMRARKT